MSKEARATRWRCVWVSDSPLVFDVLGHVAIFSECAGSAVAMEHACNAAVGMMNMGDDVIAVIVPDGYETQAMRVMVAHRTARLAGRA